MQETEQTNTATIFPLSPDPSLASDGRTEVHFEFLDEALNGSQAERIHNIAITGGFGTGKSSLIRSYESNKRKDERDQDSSVFPSEEQTGFMYVSIGEYSSDNDPHLNLIKRNGAKEQENGASSINAVERRILLQLFARFRKADLPQSAFRLIPEEGMIHHRWIAFFIGVFVFAALLLSFHESLGKLLIAVNDMPGGPNWGAWIMEHLIEYKTLIRFILAAYCTIFGAIAVTFLCMYILPRIRFRAFTVKGANAELSVERKAVESYLDLYSMELVYCLEKIARKIDRVVVFEDLDRLRNSDCLHIMTRLREINTLVNLRLQQKDERLTFIYAINDGFLELVQHEKFFDYILPVVPEMNRRSAAKLFADKIKQGIDNDYEVADKFPQFETVVSCLSDYRLQNTILNEFHVLQKLYCQVHRSDDQARERIKPEDSIRNELLAFAIYKNCWPGDYHALREGNSQTFTKEGVKCPDHLKNAKYGNLLQVLTDPNNRLLTPHCVYYVSFDEKVLADYYSERWEKAIEDPERRKGIISELTALQEWESECLAAVQKFFSNRGHLKKEDPKKKPEYYVEVFRAVVECMVRCRQKDNSWFFDPDHYFSCISLLAKMDDDGDEELKRKFFRLHPDYEKADKNLYGANDSSIIGLRYSCVMLKELCRGVGDERIPKGIHVCSDEGKEFDAAEIDQLIQQIRLEFKQSET